VNKQSNDASAENFNRAVTTEGTFEIDRSTLLTLDLDKGNIAPPNRYLFDNSVFKFGADYPITLFNNQTINSTDHLGHPGSDFLDVVSDTASIPGDFGIFDTTDNKSFDVDNINHAGTKSFGLLWIFVMLFVGTIAVSFVFDILENRLS
ncbi:MAG: hypothetical protein AAGA67_03415, partial [Cyanobacteria bacterium P01_F01_bin.153]